MASARCSATTSALQGNAFGDFAGERASPWSGGAADSQLARDAGINHIGDHAKEPIQMQANDQYRIGG